MNRIRKGDQVIVIAGKNKGQKGEVLKVDGDRVVVANVNLVKRHTKPNPQANNPGGIVEREACGEHAETLPVFHLPLVLAADLRRPVDLRQAMHDVGLKLLRLQHRLGCCRR